MEAGTTLFKPGFVSAQDGGGVLGLKVVSVRPNNEAQHGLPNVPATVMLFDEKTGVPTALMEGASLTAVRTAAGSGVATSLLAAPDAKVVTIFGAGMQAEAHAFAMAEVRDIEKVVIVSRTEEKARKLAEKLRQALPNVQCEVESDGQKAVAGSDIVCCTTSSSTPVLKGKWLKKGCHVNAIGSFRPNMQEVDADVVKMSRVVVDDIGAALAETGDLLIPISDGTIAKEHVLGTIGDALTFAIRCRESTGDITLFKSVGTAAQDLTTAAMVVRKAVERGVGQSFSF
mmetsp:Transcript_4376/g.8865  ORF Transcript_4376/g.8865 Transcript_4376/m.8865 type:complete len:286 (-) Transcript_4376:2339-3196(-)